MLNFYIKFIGTLFCQFVEDDKILLLQNRYKLFYDYDFINRDSLKMVYKAAFGDLRESLHLRLKVVFAVHILLMNRIYVCISVQLDIEYENY